MLRPDVQALLLWGSAHRRWSASTCRSYGYWAARLLGWLDARDLDVMRAGARDLAAWVASLPPTAASRNGARSAAAALFDYAIAEELRADNPARAVARARERRRVPVTITDDETRALWAAARASGPMPACLVAVLLYAMLRVGEAARLRWDGWHDGWLAVLGKGGHERELPLHPHARGALQAWQAVADDPTWVFPSPRFPGEPARVNGLREVVRGVGERAGIRGLTPHTLRRTQATALSARGVPLEELQELLGHASPKTTRAYVEVRAPRLADAVVAVDWETRAA